MGHAALEQIHVRLAFTVCVYDVCHPVLDASCRPTGVSIKPGNQGYFLFDLGTR
jgi:hypothetical protein